MAYDEATVQQSTEFLIEYCASMQDDTVEQWETMTDFALESQLTQAGLPFTKDGFLGALDAWQSAEKECGEYVSHGDYTYEASKDELQVSTEAEFADRDAHITFVFDENQYLDSMTVDAEYTTGEILKKAGGLKKGADVSGINQTQDLSDHSVLVVGKQQEQKKISINSATEKELQTLTGIGPSMAQRIIAYRSQQPFQTIEDIMKVKGIKEKLFAKIKEQITL